VKLAFTLTGVVFMFSWGSAQASFVDDGTELSKAIPAIRSAIGNRPRILRIEVEPNVVIVEAQDPNNLTHVNRWRCVNHIGILPIQWVFGPEPVDLQLLDPDLEANLFDLDVVAFSAVGLSMISTAGHWTPRRVGDVLRISRFLDPSGANRLVP
jgi:hypothetical protein